MANAHSTLASLFTDIAKAIRSKTGSSASIAADNFPTAISSIEVKENLDSELSTQDSLIAQINTALAGKVGKELPTLSNPAGAGNIEAGYQAVDGEGNLLEGSLVPPKVASGSFTPTAKVSSYTVDCDFMPDCFCILTYDSTSSLKQLMIVKTDNGYYYSAINGSLRFDPAVYNNDVLTLTNGKLTISNFNFDSGDTYWWYACA